MKTNRILFFFLIILISENCIAESYEHEDYDKNSLKESNFTGGYVALAVQRGKSSDGIKFWAFQISAGVALPHNIEKNLITPFAGLTVGKKYFDDMTSYKYYDLQLAIYPYTGIGVGKAKINEKSHNRIKGWIGYGPFIYSGDVLFLPNEKIQNGGLMLSIPVLYKFGNQFYP